MDPRARKAIAGPRPSTCAVPFDTTDLPEVDQKNAADTERDRAAKHTTDVVGIANSLEDDQRSCRCDHSVQIRRLWTMNERKAAAVEVEAGNAVDDGLARDEHVVARRDGRTKCGERGGRQQDGRDAIAAVREETLDDEPALRDEEAARLEPSRIADVAIRRQARVVDWSRSINRRCDAPTAGCDGRR